MFPMLACLVVFSDGRYYEWVWLRLIGLIRLAIAFMKPLLTCVFSGCFCLTREQLGDQKRSGRHRV